jgi:acyl phosphate:glycerol-3-phosphate acyltransferase
MAIIAVIIAAYLIGSVSFAVLTAKVFRLPDPRTYGSGNPGATNVLRSGKKLAALLTLLGDAGKGAVAVGLARFVLRENPDLDVGVAMAGLAAFLGHVYPIYYRFQGGKGVATAVGILLAFSVSLGLSVLLIWLIVVGATRFVSLASVASAVAAAPIAVLLHTGTAMATAISAMGLLIIWRHAANIRRLRAGTESKIFAKKN